MTDLSIIITTYNRALTLYNCIESILKQDLNNNFSYEVLIIDNNSTDDSQRVVESFSPKTNHKIKYFLENQQGKGFALNRGIKESCGDYLIFTDDDVIVDPQWLNNIIGCFITYNCDAVGGRVLPQYPLNTPRWIKDHSDILKGPIVMYDYGPETHKLEKPMLEFLGCNFAFKKEIFKELGLFRTDIGPGKRIIGDDTEFVSRLIQNNKFLCYCGSALVTHPVDVKRMSLRYIAQWNISLGKYYIASTSQGSVDNSLIY
ncbi:MAG: glycosyltransferase family 2 protein [Candidatus Omnitrophica bacterium]|nr:glycosyltransferase family 2 protein [Candidatus Omnitrophota bacterium]